MDNKISGKNNKKLKEALEQSKKSILEILEFLKSQIYKTHFRDPNYHK